MAIEMTTKPADRVIPVSAYWVPAHIHVDVAGKGGNIIFHAFESSEAMDAGAAPLNIPQRHYPFSEADFYAAQATTMGQLGIADASTSTTFYEVLARFAYGTAKMRKDKPVLDENGEPVLNEDGTPKMESFFKDGADV